MSMRHLERKLDPEACRRIRLGIKPHSESLPAKRLKPIRKAPTYRAARRNEALHGDVHSTWQGAKARSEPYHSDAYRIADSAFGGRIRVPTKTYKPNGKRECERRQRQREAREVV